MRTPQNTSVTRWMMFQSWQRQLFAHWPVPASVLRALVPRELELDDFQGDTLSARAAVSDSQR